MGGWPDGFRTSIPETRSDVAQNIARAAAEQGEAIIKDFNDTEGSFWLIVSVTGANWRFSHVQSRFFWEIAS